MIKITIIDSTKIAVVDIIINIQTQVVSPGQEELTDP